MTLDEEIREALRQGRSSDAIRLIRLILETGDCRAVEEYELLLECLIESERRHSGDE